MNPKLKPLIMEMVSPIVYYHTSIYSLPDILASNKFQLSVAYGTPSDRNINRGKLYFLSVSRIKFGGYERSNFNKDSVSVNMVLDGQKFNNNYKGISVDYWGPEWKTIGMMHAGGLDSFLRNDENEDRVVSNKDEIPNAKSFIKEIHIYLPEQLRPKEVQILKGLTSQFKPIYYYKQDTNAYKTLNKAKAVTTFPYGDMNDKSSEEEWPDHKYGMHHVPECLEIFKSKDLKDMSEEANDFAYRLRFADDYVLDDIVPSIESSIHNNKTNKLNRPDIRDLGNAMLKLHAHSVREFLQKLQDKIRNIKGDEK